MPDAEATAVRKPSPREASLNAVIYSLIDRLAVSQACLHAVHGTIDTFYDLERGKAQVIDGLCRTAEKEVFAGSDKYQAWMLDAVEMIKAEREGTLTDVRKTDSYIMLQGIITEMVKEQTNGQA